MFSAAARLAPAYLDTDYIVRGAVIRVAERSASVDRMLGRGRARAAVFVTACNPEGRAAPRAENLRRLTRFRAYVADRGLSVRSGIGRGRDGAWPPEPSLLVLGVSLRAGAALGRIWRQNAVVFVRAKRGAVLVGLR